MARTMISEYSLPKYFWAEAIFTACHVLNRTNIRAIIKKTPYEIFNDKKPNISYFHVFGCRCFILKTQKESHTKFDTRSDEG
ncbi:hypothetical protein EE085_29460, partial [Klebsiella pneumoniae]|nr:hypothetical protein [Klebsiella pneumoniae]